MADFITIARPYAQSFFAVDQTANDFLTHLAQFLIQGQDVLAQPQLSLQEKSTWIKTGLTETLKKSLSETQSQFIDVLVENKRVQAEMGDALLQQYIQLQQQMNQELSAYVETAFPLSETQIQQLMTQLQQQWNVKKILPEIRVNAELIAGVKVTAGDRVFEASMLNQLKQLTQSLIG